MSDKGSKTEQPTGKKLQDARDRGNVPRSQELSAVFGLAGFLLFCRWLGPAWMENVHAMMVETLASAGQHELNPTEWTHRLVNVLYHAAKLALIPIGILAVSSISGTLVQGKPPLTSKPLKPDFNKLNPFKGIKKVIKPKSLVDLSKALFKMALFTAVALMAVRDALVEGLPGSPGAEGAFQALFGITGEVLFRIIAVWFVLALIDLLWTRYDYVRGLRMTKQEIKEERKQAEGDPRVKSRIRSKQLEAARRRMMEDVSSATVVITNPTRYAVALRYLPGQDDVPQVVAKGQALLAQRIRDLAEEHGVPIHCEPPLARALYRSVPIGGYIPEKLFRAVAEILALVLGRGRRRDRR